MVVHMIKSGESLERVVELLYLGKKIPNLIRKEIEKENEKEKIMTRSRSRSRGNMR